MTENDPVLTAVHLAWDRLYAHEKVKSKFDELDTPEYEMLIAVRAALEPFKDRHQPQLADIWRCTHCANEAWPCDDALGAYSSKELAEIEKKLKRRMRR